MARNHLLSHDFDISPTFREKIRKNQQQEDIDVNLLNVKHIISQKTKIDYIQCSSDILNYLYLEGKRYSLNKDELVMIIRESDHLYYDKKKELFINLKIVRTIERKNNEGNPIFSYNIGKGIEFTETKFNDFDELFTILDKLKTKSIKKNDFDLLKIQYFGLKSTKYIHKSLFVKENKYLEESNRFSIINILSVSLFYFIPFIPFVGINSHSLTIFPITTLLIIGLFYRRYAIKKKILDIY